MTQIGTLSGRGQLHVGDDDLGEVQYSIDVLVERNMKVGRGWVRGDYDPLNKAFTSDNVTLHMGGDRAVKIIIKSLNNDGALILTSGAIPGY